MFAEPLRAIQQRYGYLPVDEIKALSVELGVRLHSLHEFISFFPHFRMEPPPDVVVRVCRDQACHLAGAAECLMGLQRVAAEFGEKRVKIEGERLRHPGEPLPVDEIVVKRVKVDGVSCLGQCDGAPAVLIELHRKGHHDEARVLLRPRVADFDAALREIVKAHLDGQPVPPDPVDHSPRGWRIDPYSPAATEHAGAATGESPGPTPRSPYAAALAFAEAVNDWEPSDTAPRKAVGSALLEQLKVSDLRGMGGAGRPAYTKWTEVRDEAERAAERGDDEVYVICNGDESEPSTFKDREILLRAPHLVVEGMVLGALVVGARRGFVYIRHEYHEQIHAVEEEIFRARKQGVVGPNVLGTGHTFELEVFESPGGYVCGEQSALIEAIEEHRAEPRNRPPVIEANGLYNKPTLLNNVETFAWVPSIALNGGAWYRDSSITESPWYLARRKPDDKPENWPRGRGMRFFSICGDVARPGVFEVPVGLTVGELIEKAGGMRDGLPLLAVATSGPSGGLQPAWLKPADLPLKFRRNFPAGPAELSLLELPLDKAEFDRLGLLLGAGLLVVAGLSGVSPAARVLDVALNCTRFFRNESCGKCVPCRVGSQKLVLIGERLQSGPADANERAELFGLVRALQETMEQTSICSLGTSASKPLASLYEHEWPGAAQ